MITTNTSSTCDTSLGVPRPKQSGEDGEGANRNVALRYRKIKKTLESALAARERTAIGRYLGSPRTARAIVKGASIAIAMINRNAIACT
jgi:hypothetical protein